MMGLVVPTCRKIATYHRRRKIKNNSAVCTRVVPSCMRPARESGCQEQRTDNDQASRTGSRSSGSENSGCCGRFAKQTECGNDEKKLATSRPGTYPRPVKRGMRHGDRAKKAGCALDRQCSIFPRVHTGCRSVWWRNRAAGRAAQGWMQQPASSRCQKQPTSDISEKKEGRKNRPSSRLPKNRFWRRRRARFVPQRL